MDINCQLFLAIDTAFDEGRVVIFDQNGDIKSEQALVGKMSHGTQICGAIEHSLLAIKNQPLKAVMVGLGPGSFVGLRIALATALGYSFGRGLPLMGFCSHRALAYSSSGMGDLAVMTKASGNLVYLTKFKRELNTLIKINQTIVIDKNEALDKHLDGFLILSDLELGNETIFSQGPSAAAMVRACLDKIAINGVVDESSFIKPNYIKGPNISVPKNSPIVGHLLGEHDR